MKRKPYYEVYQGADKQWRWRQVAANGQKTAAQGEPSASKRGAVQAVIVSARITYQLLHSPIGYTLADWNLYVKNLLRSSGGLRICPPWVGKSPHYRQPRWENMPWIYGDHK